MTATDQSATAPILAAPAPPGAPLPLFAFMRAVRDNVIATFPREAFERDVVETRFLWLRSTIISDPVAIRHVLLDNAANYAKDEITRRLLEPALGKGLITSEGETWRHHRRVMAPSFDPRSILGYAPIMTEIAGDLLARWDALPPGTVVDVAAAMMQATLHIISRTMFSSDSAGIVDLVEHGVARYQSEVRPTLLDFLGLPRWISSRGRTKVAARVLSEFDAVLNRLIAERARNPGSGPNDLLARLIAARDEETGGGMTHQEVRDQVVTIFLAGHETTSLALTWTWYLLSQHPAEEARLHAELDAVLGGRMPNHEDLARLPYTRMVVEEAMRLYPPVHSLSARVALADDEVCGHPIPKGSFVFIVPWVLHRHRRLWDHPDRFDPLRFSPERAAARPRFSYLPFGAGPRICIGAAFAMAEAMLILATLGQRYRLRLAPGHPVAPQGLITLRARHGMKMTLEPRG